MIHQKLAKFQSSHSLSWGPNLWVQKDGKAEEVWPKGGARRCGIHVSYRIAEYIFF